MGFKWSAVQIRRRLSVEQETLGAPGVSLFGRKNDSTFVAVAKVRSGCQ
jgi:hypothetical protein